jgi:hypothetical protein
LVKPTVGGTLKLPNLLYFDDFLVGPGYTANNATVASAQGKFSELADMGEWLVTVVDGGADNGETIGLLDSQTGGQVQFVTNDADNDSLNMQLNGEGWKLHASDRLLFEIRLHFTDVSEIDWFVGLSITDTALLPTSGTDYLATDLLGFGCHDSTGDIDAVNSKDSTETITDTTSNLADGTFVVLRVEATTTEATFYVDGALKATHTTNIPDDEHMTPTMEFRNDGAAAQTVTVDYILVNQPR